MQPSPSNTMTVRVGAGSAQLLNSGRHRNGTQANVDRLNIISSFDNICSGTSQPGACAVVQDLWRLLTANRPGVFERLPRNVRCGEHVGAARAPPGGRCRAAVAAAKGRERDGWHIHPLIGPAAPPRGGWCWRRRRPQPWLPGAATRRARGALADHPRSGDGPVGCLPRGDRGRPAGASRAAGRPGSRGFAGRSQRSRRLAAGSAGSGRTASAGRDRGCPGPHRGRPVWPMRAVPPADLGAVAHGAAGG
jgi:hypothetical protein